jgi:UDP-N-acetylglucosamine transferase subunit ALG13
MIFVTVGTEQFPFNRLLDWVDRAICKGKIQEQVIVQAGACTHEVSGALMHTMLTQKEFREISQQARVIISHCGEGSFFTLRDLGRDWGKPFILVPRRHGLEEHVDDHQWEMAKALDKVGVPMGWMPVDIQDFIQEPPVYREVELPDSFVIDSMIKRYTPVEQGEGVSLEGEGMSMGYA